MTEDEIALWKKVAEQTARLHPERKSGVGPKPKPKPIKQPRPLASLPAFRLGEKAENAASGHDLWGGISDQVARAPLQMDKKTFGRLKRGKLMPEGRIDLHGMTIDQAHPALTGFILRASAEGKRLVLVITGKGKSKPDDGPIPVRRGVLKHQVPQWLSMPPMASHVLQVAEAHLKHGGTGAYYVYLRR
nr:Smr/MutS family protein [Shimia biformata]